jgi:hypothetical protein
MGGKIKEKVQLKPEKEACGHYWVIEVANGPMSRGKCKYCGATKEFYNAFPEFNPLKKNAGPLNMPELPAVEVDDSRKS